MAAASAAAASEAGKNRSIHPTLFCSALLCSAAAQWTQQQQVSNIFLANCVVSALDGGRTTRHAVSSAPRIDLYIDVFHLEIGMAAAAAAAVCTHIHTHEHVTAADVCVLAQRSKAKCTQHIES